MKFRVIWSISEDKWLPIMKLWSSMTPQQRADGGAGVKIIGRWHDMASRTGVLICEATDLAAVLRYAGQWNPHMGLEIAPVVDDEEAAAIGKDIVAASGT